MKELFDKYYVFTITFVVLAISLFVFRTNSDLVNLIIGGFMGLIASPVVLPKIENKI